MASDNAGAPFIVKPEIDKYLLSILIPSIPERFEIAQKLFRKIYEQLGDHVEILLLMDNKQMSIGEKRNKLLSMAKGKFIAFCDDDDDITSQYYRIVANAHENVDVITFKQDAMVDGHKTIVDFDLSHTENDVFVTDGITKRKPFHVCAWRRNLVQNIKFPHINWGEDDRWVEKALRRVKTQKKIDEILHIYTHDKAISRAYAD